MSLLSDNILPGKQGKTFGTDARDKIDLERIRQMILELDGIKDVIFKTDIYPVEFVVHTKTLVAVKDVERKVRATGFHATPLGIHEF